MNTVYVCGFPDYKAQPQLNEVNSLSSKDVSKMKIMKGCVNKIKNNYIYYNIETLVGQAGGAIILIKQNKFYLIGLHSQYNTK